MLKAAQIPIEKLFEIADVGKKGRLTPVEFRNTIRYLNLALTSREIDIIFNRADTNKNGYIEIKEFISKFRATDTEN